MMTMTARPQTDADQRAVFTIGGNQRAAVIVPKSPSYIRSAVNQAWPWATMRRVFRFCGSKKKTRQWVLDMVSKWCVAQACGTKEPWMQGMPHPTYPFRCRTTFCILDGSAQTRLHQSLAPLLFANLRQTCNQKPCVHGQHTFAASCFH